MKLMKKILVVVLCAIIPALIYLKVPNTNRQAKSIAETKVVIVNEDEGVYIGEEYYIFSQNLITEFIKSSNFDATTTNYADAFSMLENGEVMYVLVFDRNFSKSVNEFNVTNPTQGVIRYYYNHTYNAYGSGNMETENARNEIFEQLQNDLSIVYTKTIIAEVEDSKRMLSEDVDKDIELIDNIKKTTESNANSLSGQLQEMSSFISTFENNMGEKISEVNDKIADTKDSGNQIISVAEENSENTTTGKTQYETIAQDVETVYKDNYEDYLEHNALLVSEEGLATKVIDYYVPMYDKYDEQYRANFAKLSEWFSFADETENLCEGIYDENNFTLTKEKLTMMKMSAVDYNAENPATSPLIEVPLYTTEEIDALVSEAYTYCNAQYIQDRETYNSGETEAIDNIYSGTQSNFISDVNTESTREGVNYLDVYGNLIIKSTDPLGGYVEISGVQVGEFNSLRKVLSIMANGAEPSYVTLDSNHYYMTPANYNKIEKLKGIVLSEYNSIAGDHISLSETVTDGYGLVALSAQDGSIINSIKSEYEDILLESSVLNSYSNTKFYDYIIEKVLDRVSMQFFVVEGDTTRTMSALGGELELFTTTNIEQSEQLLKAYEEQYQGSLQKLESNSELIVLNYDKSNELNATIVETGTINLDNLNVMSEKNTLVLEENVKINNHFLGINERGMTVNDQVKTNQDSYSSSVESLEAASEEQKKFVEQYGSVLSNANIDGVSNNQFYSFITNPIMFERLEVNEKVNIFSSYFILFFMIIGVLLISVMKDKFPSIFTLNFSSGSFNEGKIIRWVNNYLISSIVLTLFAITYGFALTTQFTIDNAVLFILQLLILVSLMYMILRIVVHQSKWWGYGIFLWYIAIMYILLYSEEMNMLERVIAIPLTVLDNFIKVNIYNFNYTNSFLYSVIVYGGMGLIIYGIIYSVTLLTKRKGVTHNE